MTPISELEREKSSSPLTFAFAFASAASISNNHHHQDYHHHHHHHQDGYNCNVNNIDADHRVNYDNYESDSDEDLMSRLKLGQDEQEPCRIGTSSTAYLPSLDRAIDICEDSSGGCGGKAWEAADVLLAHLDWKGPDWLKSKKRIIELGAGTGIVGIGVAAILASAIEVGLLGFPLCFIFFLVVVC